MVAMSHLDKDIHDLFEYSEHKIMEKVGAFLTLNDIKPSHMNEKIHIAYNLIEELCHEYVYHKHDDIDYDYMIKETTHLVKTLFTV